MKKILYLLSSNTFSGAENVVCTIIKNLSDEYETAYCSPTGEIEKIVKDMNIKYFGINKMNHKNVNKVIKEFKPDIIHANDYRASIIVATLGFKGKIISHIHNNCPFAKSWNLKTLVYNYTINKYSKVIGVSNEVYNEAIFKNKLKGKYVTIYNYLDSENIIKKANMYSYKKQYDLFFIGRLTKQKNPQAFINLIEELKERYCKDISGVMLGTGELEEECKKLIKEFKLEDNIDLLGFVENPFPIIKRCKVGVLPSKWEGFGLVAIEAMILGKPILNSGVGGLAEIFKNNKNLVCCDDEYSTKAIELLDDEMKYKETISNIKTIVKPYTNKEKYIQKLKKIYD